MELLAFPDSSLEAVFAILKGRMVPDGLEFWIGLYSRTWTWISNGNSYRNLVLPNRFCAADRNFVTRMQGLDMFQREPTLLQCFLYQLSGSSLVFQTEYFMHIFQVVQPPANQTFCGKEFQRF